MTLRPGDRLVAYEIIEEIGRGGMATVYRAHQRGVNRDVAIKVLPAFLAQNESFLIRFRQEAQIIAQLEHIHVLPVYDFGQEGDLLYIVMRYIPSGTLADRVKRDGALAPAEVARIIEQLAGALDYSHRRQIVHRDLKPANIFMDSSDNVLLGDFGIARAAEASMQLTGSKVMGTPAYISPEQARGERDIDGRADQYSLGIIAYELLTGQRPFRANTPVAMMMEHLRTPLPDPREIVPDLPSEVYHVLRIASAKEVNRRYTSCTAFAKSMQTAIRRNVGDSASTTASPGRRNQPTPASNQQTLVSSRSPQVYIPPVAPTPVAAEPVYAAPEPVPVPTPAAPTPEPRKRRGWGLLLLLFLFMVVMLGTGAAAYYFRDQWLPYIVAPVATPLPPTITLVGLTGETFTVAPNELPFEISIISQSEVGIAYTLYYINDELIAVDQPPENNDQTEQQSTFEFTPDGLGDYTIRIEAVALDSQVTELTLTIEVAGDAVETILATAVAQTATAAAAENTPEPAGTTPAAAATPTPTATATQTSPAATPTPTATATITNTPPPTRTPTTSGPRQVDGTFTASSLNINAGQSSTLSWNLQANQAFIFSVVLVELTISSGSPQQTTLASGVQQTNGTRLVTPGENTTYRLDIFYNDAQGNSVVQQKSLTIIVNP